MYLSPFFCVCLLSIGHVTDGWGRWFRRRSSAPAVHVTSSNLYGCYVDQWSRTLNGGMTKSNSMTVSKCFERCKRENKKYYGLEVGVECFCGNYLTKTNKKSTNDCKMACKGRRSEACGNHWRVLIYKNPYYSSIIVKSGYMGCYKDQWSRTLNGKKTTSSRMTVDMCRNICTNENTVYYGVENANECFCGNRLTRSEKKSDHDCLKQCRGNRRQGCGGAWRVAIYRNYNYKQTRVQTSGLVGCYKDQRDRVLTGGKTKSSSMTLALCRSRCQRENKKYYGLEVGEECFCGNYLKHKNKRPSSECLRPCRGNKAEGCGGNWRVVIYRNYNYKSNIVKTDYVGCYRDQWARTLGGKKTRSGSMTFEKCKSICSHKKINSIYFGLENRDECFCGNSLTRKVVRDEGECTHKCKGNSRQGCGGPWRLAVYKNSKHTKTRVSTKDILGCFIDQRSRVLDGGRTKSSHMTLEKCKNRCIREKKKYYGLEVGEECFCGNYLTRQSARPNKECMTPCKGDRTQACGSGWRVLIYKNTAYKSRVVSQNFKGCYKDQRSRTLKDYKTSSSRMTVKKCWDICHKKNYQYYGVQAKRECFCGNKLTRKVKKDSEECTQPCTGDKSQGCGGSWRLAVYTNSKFPTKVSTTHFVGCFKDQRSRTLNGGKTVSKSMTMEKCQQICEKKNMKYFGLEVGEECFCGNYLTKYEKKDKEDCLMACRGNIKQGCGGHWRVLIYKNPKYKTNIVQKEYVGCYKDQWSRTLKDKKTTSKKMTVNMCRKTCLGLKMKYYGLEATNECFCGLKLSKKVVKADGECTRPCKGDKSQACGGSWRLAVYENPAFQHTAIVKKEYLGCYKDQWSRTLKEKKTRTYDMTVDKCRKICTDLKFKYYGVEAAKECFCGNKLTKSNKKKDSECMTPCKGDREQACGGSWRLAVYKNPNFKPTAIVKTEYIGCYKDQVSRTLKAKKIRSKTMTVDKCRKTCSDLKYKYYGVEASNECFCGNKLTQSNKKKDSDCMRPCKGDREQACGGSWRLAVYQIKTKKSPTICKDTKGEIQCNSNSGERSVCIVPKAELVLSVEPKSSGTECEAGKTYGRHGDEIWVSDKCGGKFEVCYRQAEEKEVSNDCIKTADGSDYTGTWNKTKSGKTCQAWSSQTPHKHGHTSLPNNYCRNPDGEPHAWCYTTDPKTRWEFCDLKQCEAPKPGEAEECLTEPKGQNYLGTKNITKSGLTCQAWSSQTPHSHSFSKTLGNQENYCRNPDGEPKPWCYTTDKAKRWEFCDIPECAACDVEQEKGPDCKVIYKISGSCHYESHYSNECKYTVSLKKGSTGTLKADVKYGTTKFSLADGKGVNKCAYFKIIGDYMVIEDKLAHGC